MIYEKLFKVQQTLVAPKDQYNNFGKYKYRSCEGILEALKPLMAENKLTVILSDSVKEIGSRVYVEATATAVDVETGESTSVTAYAREEESKKGMDGSQVTGASSSYARKYALNGLFAIDDNKDSDVTNTGTKTDNEKPKEQAMVLTCSDCGKVISDPKTKDGKPIPIMDYLSLCMKFYGRPMCEECRAKKHFTLPTKSNKENNNAE